MTDWQIRDRVRDRIGREGTVVDFGCDESPDCLHGERCILVLFDSGTMPWFMDGEILEKIAP